MRKFLKEILREASFHSYVSDDILIEAHQSYTEPDIYYMPVEFVWEYREFDRCGVDKLKGDGYIQKLTDDISLNGIKTPITLQISSGYGLIVEGNHRLCIAKNLGLKTIPVKVILRDFGSINKHKANPIIFRPDRWGRDIYD